MSIPWKNFAIIFYHNLYLVDESILNEQLCRWLQEELNLPKLAAKLRSLFTRNFSLEEFLYPVFKEINYLTYEEMKSLNLQIQKLAEESPLLRAKCKGDALVQNDMYGAGNPGLSEASGRRKYRGSQRRIYRIRLS